MRYLLDTNICIAIIRQKAPTLLQKLVALGAGEIGVSSITVAELQCGAQKSQRPAQNQQALEQFLLPLAIADFGYEAAAAYGRIRADLERVGMAIGSFDLLIAAHALALDVALVTNNLREFNRVPLLRVEDWTAG